METKVNGACLIGIVCVSGVLGTLAFNRATAHCDTMDGPVVKAARTALARGDVTPALKWVKAEREPEIRIVFTHVLAARKHADSREIADRYFFETLVRLHRAGEGADYTGLKPSGSLIEPGVAEADRSIESGKPDALLRALDQRIATEVRSRLSRVLSARKHSDESVAAGRHYVAEYVEYVHFVGGLFAAAEAESHGHYAAERASIQGIARDHP